MRRSPFAAAALLLLAAGSAWAQFPAQVAPLPFTPYVPPVSCTGRVGRDYINCAIPDLRVLAGASFYSTEAERIIRRMYSRQVALVLPVPEPLPPPIVPEVDPLRAVVTIQVAETAEVYVEDQKLKQPGATRQFVSPVLKSGESYRYTVKVRWLDKGREREQKVQVPVQAGDHPTVVLMTPTSR